MRGMRHGYGVRTSAKFGMASHTKPNRSDVRSSVSSLTGEDAHGKAVAGSSGAEDAAAGGEGRDKKLDDARGGFVLKANSDEQPSRRKTLVSKSTHSLKRTFMSVSVRDQKRDAAKRFRAGEGVGSARENGANGSIRAGPEEERMQAIGEGERRLDERADEEE